MEEKPSSGQFSRPLSPDDLFYRAIPPDLIKPDNSISPGAFCNPNRPPTDRMSVDWAAKSSPAETSQRWERWGSGRGVASLSYQTCNDNNQTVEFTPTMENKAHSDIVGEKKERVRKNLAKAAKLVYQVP